MPTDLEKWRTKQIQAAIERGVNPLDAQKALSWFMLQVPRGANPETYVLPAYLLEENISSKEYIDDVRATWYGDDGVPPNLKRLLDASEAS